MKEISRILLIKPPLYMTNELMEFLSFPMPLGLMYLASALEKEGMTVKILDFLIEDYKNIVKIDNQQIWRVGLSNQEIIAKIKEFKPDLIGITNSFTAQFPAALDMAKTCKSIDPSIPIVIGGVHPSAAPRESISCEFIDYAVVGEGEKTLIDIINYIKGLIKENELRSCYFRSKEDKNKIIFNGFDKLIENLDSLPFPAYHLIDMEAYFKAAKFDSTTRGGSYEKWASLITSRGCPYSCIFCSEHLVYGKKWRGHSPKYVASQIRFLIEKYKIKNFSFDDGNFTFDTLRAEEIMNLIREFKIKFIFPNGIRADKLSFSLAKKLKEAGCQELTLAFEHGDQDFVNKVIKKSLNLEVALENLAYLRKLKIPITAFFIFGIPPENRQTLNKTIAMILKVAKKGVVPNISLAMPLPGTEMTEDSIIRGYLEHCPVPSELAAASNKKYLFKNTPLNGQELIREKRKIFFKAILLVLFLHPTSFFKYPFVRSTILDLFSYQGIKKRLLKIKSILNFN